MLLFQTLSIICGWIVDASNNVKEIDATELFCATVSAISTSSVQLELGQVLKTSLVRALSKFSKAAL